MPPRRRAQQAQAIRAPRANKVIMVQYINTRVKMPVRNGTSFEELMAKIRYVFRVKGPGKDQNDNFLKPSLYGDMNLIRIRFSGPKPVLVR